MFLSPHGVAPPELRAVQPLQLRYGFLFRAEPVRPLSPRSADPTPDARDASVAEERTGQLESVGAVAVGSGVDPFEAHRGESESAGTECESPCPYVRASVSSLRSKASVRSVPGSATKPVDR